MRPPARRPAALLAQFSLAPALLLALLPGGLSAADSTRCGQEVHDHLARLPLPADSVESIRIIERTNIADDFGPEILGVDAWVRLNSCSGWLVINMRPTCYMVQTYTRGDCRIEGVQSY